MDPVTSALHVGPHMQQAQAINFAECFQSSPDHSVLFTSPIIIRYRAGTPSDIALTHIQNGPSSTANVLFT